MGALHLASCTLSNASTKSNTLSLSSTQRFLCSHSSLKLGRRIAERGRCGHLVEIGKKIILPTVDATTREFRNLLCYKSNINNLAQSVEQLRLARKDANDFWESLGINNGETTHTSTAWLDKVEAAEKAANDIKEAVEKLKSGCLSKWCLNPKQRYLLSRNAVKKAGEIRQLEIDGKAYVPLIKPAPPPSKLKGAFANDNSKDFKSRAKIMDDIAEALKDDKISIIGVCGSGGVGKTTLMHELRERAKANDLFHEVAMATVSQNPDLSNIRSKLAEMLGLTRVKDEKNEIAAADELYKRLTGKGRRTLVILDDIWSEINLEELGIPLKSENTECKVVLTSRQFGICNQMKAQKIIPVATMPPKEAWYLFRKMAWGSTVGDDIKEMGGDYMVSDDIKEIAEKVADECGGLPIAIVTLAKALSGKKIGIWRDALKQLREHKVTRIPGMDQNVYSSIKMSYDFLESQQREAKPLLLLCCQHPEDAEIEVERLARYCLVLGLLENVHTIEDARNSVCALIDYLRSCFLLEAIDVDEDDKNHGKERVKMHDVVRDVGLSIVSSPNKERDRVYMHVVEQATDGEGVDFQNLKILVHTAVDGGLQNSVSFLPRMEELRVLEYSQKLDIHWLSLEFPINLRMLCLETVELNGCTLSAIGSLQKLEILSFLNSSYTGSFPLEIGKLGNLKLLDMRFSLAEQYPMPSGILPQLSKLEILCLGSCYFPGTPEGEKGIKHITELETLSNLTTLQIQLLNPMELFDLQFRFEKLERFSFGRSRRFGSSLDVWTPLVWRTLDFDHLCKEWILGDKIQFIVRRTEELQLNRITWTDPLIMEKFGSLRRLQLNDCEHLKYLICVGAFTKLEYLKLESLSGLTELCHKGNLPAGSLEKLTGLCLKDLPKMRHLWFGPSDPLCLVNLREVYIQRCGALECIFPHSAPKCLVQLQILVVVNCWRLKGIVSKMKETGTGREGIIGDPTDLILHFPKLREVTVIRLHDLRGFYNFDDSTVQTLFCALVMLPSMKELQVEGSHQLKQIVGCKNIDIPRFPKFDWLQNLELVDVSSCDSLESVFDFESMPENTNVVTLGKLQVIRLRGLQNLTHIFRCRMQDMSIPQLQVIKVQACNSIRNLFYSNFIKLLHNLKQVSLKNCGSIEALFDFEGLKVMREDARLILGELQEIKLWKLPKLEHVCRLPPKEIYIFKNLRTLYVDKCDSLGYLISSSMAQMLEKLEMLSITDCKSMKEGITMNKEISGKKIVFRALSVLTLENLEKLSSFCSNDQLEFEFPSLEKVSIISCPEMKTFCYGRLTAEKLHGVKFADADKSDWKSDLNQTIQYFNECYQEDDDSDEDFNDSSDNDDAEDDNVVNADSNGTTPHLKPSGKKGDGVSDYNAEDFDDIHVPEEGLSDESVPTTNSQLRHFNSCDSAAAGAVEDVHVDYCDDVETDANTVDCSYQVVDGS